MNELSHWSEIEHQRRQGEGVDKARADLRHRSDDADEGVVDLQHFREDDDGEERSCEMSKVGLFLTEMSSLKVIFV